MNSNFIADLTDKTAIITGGAGLIGRVYASALLQSGSNVIILDKKISVTENELDSDEIERELKKLGYI